MCQKGSGPHSAAKQGRSFRVAALNHPGSLCAQGGPSHILQQNKAVLFVWLLHFSLGQVPISRSPPFFSCGCSKPFGTPCFGVLSLRIEKWALECSYVPKGVGPHSAAKQGRFRVAALNHTGSLCARAKSKHILQQNRAVLFVWLL